MRAKHVFVFALFAVFTATPLLAHDMWIEPSSFRPRVDAPVGLTLRIGDDPAEAKAARRDSTRIVRFVSADAKKEEPIIGLDGASPAGFIRPQAAGLRVIGYQGQPSVIELEARKFESYLKGKGLEKIIALRAQHGESDKSGKERYSRCLKALVAVGSEAATGSDSPLGFPLEFLAESNPYRLETNESVSVQLVFNNNPLAGALVEATHLHQPEIKLKARTDHEGRVSFQLPQSGAWLFTAVHMVSVPQDAEADWESFWASLTFEVPEKQPGRAHAKILP